MYFKSKYKGWCWFCQTKIKKGTLISWDKETKKAKHKECPEKRPTKPTRRKVRLIS